MNIVYFKKILIEDEIYLYLEYMYTCSIVRPQR
jgi:hypothetical protein